MSYNEIFREKTKQMALMVIRFFSELPYTDSTVVIRKQIIRSATSVAANYRAMCRARSDKERYSKLCLVVEEADETLFWLELSEELNLLSAEKLNSLKSQVEEILKSTSSYRKRLSIE